MKKYLRKYLYEFFILNKTEQRGIIILFVLTLAIVGITNILPYFHKSKPVDQSKFLAQLSLFKKAQKRAFDSIHIEILQNRGELNDSLAKSKLKPFDFNPNNLPDKQWKAIGLTEKQIKTIKKYEAKGGSFRRKEDLKKIYVISDIEYRILEPFIKIPRKAAEQKKTYPRKKVVNKVSKFKIIELNSADSAQVVKALNIAPWLAVRIIKFRNLLGGYVNKKQLFEVYGFDSVEVKKRLEFIEIDIASLKKLDINESSFKELVRHPYISYDLAKHIFNLRTKTDTTMLPEIIFEKGYILEEGFKKLEPYLK